MQLTGVLLGSAFENNLYAFGRTSLFSVSMLKYDGNWNPRPSSVRKLLLEVEKRTSVQVEPMVVPVVGYSGDIFQHPFLIIAGDQGFEPFAEETRMALKRYLLAGGFLFIDSSEGVLNGDFDQSIRREFLAIFPNRPVVKLSKNHVCYKSFYLIEEPLGRLQLASYLEGVEQDDRVMVIYSQNDLLGAYSRDNFGNWEYEVFPGGEVQRDMAYRMGINLVMYSLCINYKSDQVHIPFILKRRDWKVD